MGWQRNKGQRSKEDNGIIEYTEDTTKIRTLQLSIISTGSKNGGCLTFYFCKNTFLHQWSDLVQVVLGNG